MSGTIQLTGFGRSNARFAAVSANSRDTVHALLNNPDYIEYSFLKNLISQVALANGQR